MPSIEPIRAFSDNYIWLLHAGGVAWVVDPGDAVPVLETLARASLALQGILVTHHHFDHTGGVAELTRQFPGATVAGPVSDNFAGTTTRLRQGDRFPVLDLEFEILEVPGHTLDHIAYFAHPAGGPPVLFCGDTLFAGGCGRVFEGTPAMMNRSLQLLAGLPRETVCYCAHEYTLSNLAFARAVEPDNAALERRLAEDEARQARDIPTVPSALGTELATNPFLRSDQPAVIAAARRRDPGATTPDGVFAAIRDWKNNF